MKRRQVLAIFAAISVGLVLTVAAVGYPALAQSTTLLQPSVPAGFRIDEYADLGAYSFPTSLSFGPDGKLYATTLLGFVYTLEDGDGDGVAETQDTFADGLATPLGMAWRGDELFVSVSGKIQALKDSDSDGAADQSRDVVTGLPTSGDHRNNGIAFGPDDGLYVTLGSSCDACTETDSRRATILRYDADGSNEAIYARGLRNAYDLAFYPGTPDLFATDNGRDDLGPDAPPEELNFVVKGTHYGWPHCWSGGSDPGWETYCSWPRQPVATFDAHASADGFAFYDAVEFPTQYWNDAFVALYNAGRVDWVDVTPGAGGYQATTNAFATGFKNPLDVAVGPDGALYVADYGDGTVYRIAAEPDLSSSAKRVSEMLPGPGDTLTYTLLVVNTGGSAPFTLTDAIPVSTTYAAGSAWASTGTITDVGGITWHGVVSANTRVTATFSVIIDPGLDSSAAIFNTAVLTGDVEGPLTLRALSIVSGTVQYLPLAFKGE